MSSILLLALLFGGFAKAPRLDSLLQDGCEGINNDLSLSQEDTH